MATSNFYTMDKFPLTVLTEKDGDFLEEKYILDECSDALDALNEKLLCFKTSLRSGYYAGVQIYVETLNDVDSFDKEDCYYYLDMCPSKAKKLFQKEQNMIKKEMQRFCNEYEFFQLKTLARFSNGETLYSKV